MFFTVGIFVVAMTLVATTKTAYFGLLTNKKKEKTLSCVYNSIRDLIKKKLVISAENKILCPSFTPQKNSWQCKKNCYAFHEQFAVYTIWQLKQNKNRLIQVFS